MSAVVKANQSFLSIPFNKIIVDLNKNFRSVYDDVEALSVSIFEKGLLKPITVYKGKDGLYYLIEGYTRMQAIKMLVDSGKVTDEYIVTAQKIEQPTEQDEILINLIANGGKDFQPFDKARAIKQLIDTGMTQQEVANKIGLAQPVISNLLKALTMPEDVQAAVQNGDIAFNTAIAAHRSGRMDELINIVNQPSVEIVEGTDGEPTTVKVNKKATIREFTKGDKEGENTNPIKLIKSIIREIEKGDYPNHDKEILQILKDLVDGMGTKDDVLRLLGV